MFYNHFTGANESRIYAILPSKESVPKAIEALSGALLFGSRIGLELKYSKEINFTRSTFQWGWFSRDPRHDFHHDRMNIRWPYLSPPTDGKSFRYT